MFNFAVASSYKLMQSLTTVFSCDAMRMAIIINGDHSVRLAGFAEDDLQQEHWARPSVVASHPDPDPHSLANEIVRKRNQERYAWLAAWFLSLLASATLTYVLTAR